MLAQISFLLFKPSYPSDFAMEGSPVLMMGALMDAEANSRLLRNFLGYPSEVLLPPSPRTTPRPWCSRALWQTLLSPILHPPPTFPMPAHRTFTWSLLVQVAPGRGPPKLHTPQTPPHSTPLSWTRLREIFFL